MLRFYGWNPKGEPVRDWASAARQGLYAVQPSGGNSSRSRCVPAVSYDLIIELIGKTLTGARATRADITRLLNWCIWYQIGSDFWPSGIIASRLFHHMDQSLKGRPPDEGETQEMRRLAEEISGEQLCTASSGPEVPYTTPVPMVQLSGREFVPVGHFLGGHQGCRSEIEAHGGRVSDVVSSMTDYVVIGAIRSREWLSGPIFDAIQSVVAWNDIAGSNEDLISIVSEESLFSALRKGAHSRSNQERNFSVESSATRGGAR